MKIGTLIYAMVIGCMLFSSCSESDDLFSDMSKKDISLTAVVDEVKVITRSAQDGAYTGTVPSVINNLEAAVWFSLKPGCYPATLPDDWTDEEKTLSAETNLPVHGEINFQSGTATFPNSDSDATKPKYPTTGDPVYCVGFYPKNGWTTTDGEYNKATHAINGKDDLMFAPEIIGTWNTHFRTQRYRHLLTWLKVCVCITTPEAASYWGKLKQIYLQGMPESLTIDLTKPEQGFSMQNAVSFSENTSNIRLLELDAERELKITTQEVASVFCRPASSYTLVIECENGKTKEISIDLSALNENEKDLLNYPAGLQYVLILYFHPYNVVDGVCTLNAWNAQNEDLYPDVTNQ